MLFFCPWRGFWPPLPAGGFLLYEEKGTWEKDPCPFSCHISCHIAFKNVIFLSILVNFCSEYKNSSTRMVELFSVVIAFLLKAEDMGFEHVRIADS